MEVKMYNTQKTHIIKKKTKFMTYIKKFLHNLPTVVSFFLNFILSYPYKLGNSYNDVFLYIDNSVTKGI